MTARKVLVRQAYHPKRESAYGTAIGNGEATWLSTEYMGEVTLPKALVNRGDFTGRGHEFHGAIRLVDAWDTRLSRAGAIDAYRAGQMVAFGLGSVSSADAGSGATRHTCKPLAPLTSVNLPSTTMYEQYPDEGLKAKFPGMVVESFGLSGQKGSWVEGSVEWIGNGSADFATNMTPPSLTTITPFQFTRIAAALGGANGDRDLLSRLRGFDFAWGNNLLAEDGYLPGATYASDGPLRSRCEIGNRRDSGKLKLIIDASVGANLEVTEYQAGTLWNDTTLTLRGGIVGGAVREEIKIVLPECHIDEMDPAWDGDIKNYPITLVPRYDSGLAAPLKIEVVNAVSAYLEAAA